jgi:transposase-like protein
MGRKRHFPPELKKRIVDEAVSEGNVAAVSRRYGVSRHTVYRWMAEDQAGTLLRESGPLSPSETKRLVDDVARLKQMLGEKELENEILKDLLKKTAQRSGTKSR